MPDIKKNGRPEERPSSQSSRAKNDETRQTARHHHSSIRRKHRKINNSMIVLLLLASILIIGVFAYNFILINKGVSLTSDGDNQTLAVDTKNTMKNDLYEIGNNPTQLEQDYFQQLTSAIQSGNKEEIAAAVAENFVADYFTWTNKDGNYEVGGLQYIYSDKVSAFDTWSRYNYYADMDLYISQYGRDHLPEVTEITVKQPATATDDFTVSALETAQTYSAWLIDLTWKYQMGSNVPSDNFINGARFLLVDNNGRMEIAEWYDLDSVYAWSEANGVSPDFSGTAVTEASSSPVTTAESASDLTKEG